MQNLRVQFTVPNVDKVVNLDVHVNGTAYRIIDSSYTQHSEWSTVEVVWPEDTSGSDQFTIRMYNADGTLNQEASGSVQSLNHTDGGIGFRSNDNSDYVAWYDNITVDREGSIKNVGFFEKKYTTQNLTENARLNFTTDETNGTVTQYVRTDSNSYTE
jgi:hypothetical protein